MSSKRRLRRKSCSGKRAYANSTEGMTMMNLKRNTGDTAWFNVYKCKFCKRYHIGHASRR